MHAIRFECNLNIIKAEQPTLKGHPENVIAIHPCVRHRAYLSIRVSSSPVTRATSTLGVRNLRLFLKFSYPSVRLD